MQQHEQRFYLEQFRDQLLVIGHAGVPGDDDTEHIDDLVERLASAGVNVIVVHAGRARTPSLDDDHLVELWRLIDEGGVATIGVEPDSVRIGATSVPRALEAATALAARLRANKLVLVTRDHGRTDTGGRVDESYISIDIDEQHDGAVELSARALRAGVGSVNVVDAAGLADELLSYRGAGTLYTAHDYVMIDRVGFGDFAQVMSLIEAGAADGFLKPRSDAEIRQLVVNGYGARVDGDHVAGFVALLIEPYATDNVGEITALTTISRFAGGGVGGRLVERLIDVADAAGLESVFATTTSPDAVRFFERLGFEPVDRDQIPAAKWDGYDPQRLSRVTSLRYLLGDRAPQVGSDPAIDHT